MIVMFMPCIAMSGENRTDHDKVHASTGHKKKNNVLSPLHTEKYEYYEVCGCCEKDLQCEMSDKAIRWKDGNRYDSVTNWKVKWDYDYNRGPETCFADSFRVNIDIIFHLPKWVCSHAPQSLLDRWDNYIKKLISHENEHRDLALGAAADLTRTVAELPPVRTCAELDRKINDLCHERMQKLDEDQKAYDETTSHGFKELSFP